MASASDLLCGLHGEALDLGLLSQVWTHSHTVTQSHSQRQSQAQAQYLSRVDGARANHVALCSLLGMVCACRWEQALQTLEAPGAGRVHATAVATVAGTENMYANPVARPAPQRIREPAPRDHIQLEPCIG